MSSLIIDLVSSDEEDSAYEDRIRSNWNQESQDEASWEDEVEIIERPKPSVHVRKSNKSASPISSAGVSSSGGANAVKREPLGFGRRRGRRSGAVVVVMAQVRC